MIDRLLADADLKRAVLIGLLRRNPEIDFKRAEEVPLEGLGDPIVLGVAAGENRVLVSHDVSTLAGHFRQFVRGRGSPGVILIPQQLAVGAAIEGLLLVCDACDPRDLEKRICLIPSLRNVRALSRPKLPIGFAPRSSAPRAYSRPRRIAAITRGLRRP